MSFWARLKRTWRTDPVIEQRIREEMDFHLEMRTEELVARGMSRQAALKAARAALGHRVLQEESVREARTVVWLADLGRDLGFALRGLRRRPGLLVTGSLSLGLGIAMTTTLFAVLDAVALKPIPVPDLDRLFVIRETKDGNAIGGNPLRLGDYGSQVTSFSAVTGFYGEGVVLVGRGDPIRVSVQRTFGDFTQVVGLTLTAGRGFSAAEQRGEGAVAVVRSSAAVAWFGPGAERALGQVVRLDDGSYTVIGVASDDSYPSDTQIWMPAPASLQAGPRRGSYLFSVAKLAEGVPASRARTELAVVQRRLAQAYPETDAGREASLESLQSALVGERRSGGLVLLAISMAVLLIASLNVASLLLARAAERHRESAIRLALGAGVRRLVRLYFAESVVIGLIGGAVGILLASIAVPVIRSVEALADLPRIGSAAVDIRALGFTLVLMVLATVTFGTLPAIRAADGALLPALARAATRRRSREILVMAQCAVTLVLLVAAATLVDGFSRLRNTPPGFATERSIVVRVDLPWGATAARLNDFRQRALDAMSTISGVDAVAVMDRLPLQGGTQSGRARVVGREIPAELAAREVSIRAVSPSYFAAMAIPLRAGASLGERGTAVVNEEFARLWLGDQAIGRQIVLGDGEEIEVVGVAAGVRQSSLDDRIMPEVFIRAEDTYWPLLTFVVRTSAPVAAVATTVRARLREVDPDQVVDRISTMERELATVTSTPKALATLVSAFAAVAAVLVAVGLFGVLSGHVAQRAREIALRIALGATPHATIYAVAAKGMLLAFLGVACGLLVSFATGDALARFPIVLRINQPIVLVIASAGFLLVALLAAAIPSWRASRIDPARLLRLD